MKASQKAKSSLRLRRGETLAKGIRRIARSQMDSARRALQGDERTAVHEARKALKKLRALLGLVAPEFGRKAFCDAKKPFQEAARLLSPLRDAEVRLVAFDALLQNRGFDPADFAPLRKMLVAANDQSARKASRSKTEALERLRRGWEQVERWPLGDLKWEHLQREIRRTYRKGRKALEIHQREQTPESFHAWRKRVKALWYHLRIAEVKLSKVAADRIALCDEIGETAGNAHDLAILRETLLAQKTSTEMVLLVGEIEVRMAQLQQAALECGARLYNEKPGEFAERVL